ncbi:MAG TPA: hypothetical protein VGJ89_03930 [Geothrix sp.]|jgi:rhombotail lipoprotein
MRSSILSLLAALVLLAAGCGVPETVQRRSSLSAYMVKGDKNDTTSMVDAAVYHAPSRTFLFRAGGVGTAKGSSTWSRREEAFRQQSRESLALAMTQLSASIDQGVATFKQDILKGARKDVQLIDKIGNPLGSPAYDPARP